MPLNADELVQKSKVQRERRRYEEALISSIAAAESDHDNAGLGGKSPSTGCRSFHFSLGWTPLGTHLFH